MSDEGTEALMDHIGKIKKEFHLDMMRAVQDVARDVENRLAFIEDETARQLVLYEIMIFFLTVEISDIISCFEPDGRARLIEEMASAVSRLSSGLAGKRNE